MTKRTPLPRPDEEPFIAEDDLRARAEFAQWMRQKAEQEIRAGRLRETIDERGTPHAIN